MKGHAPTTIICLVILFWTLILCIILKNAEVRTAHIALVRSLASLRARKVFFPNCDVKFLSFWSGNILLNHIQLASGSQVSSCHLYSPNPFLNSIARFFFFLFLGAWMRSQPYPLSDSWPPKFPKFICVYCSVTGVLRKVSQLRREGYTTPDKNMELS